MVYLNCIMNTCINTTCFSANILKKQKLGAFLSEGNGGISNA